jgi:hypothetical protein
MEMPQPGKTGHRVPGGIIETVNKVVRTSQQMLPEIGRAPTPRNSPKSSR